MNLIVTIKETNSGSVEIDQIKRLIGNHYPHKHSMLNSRPAFITYFLSDYYPNPPYSLLMPTSVNGFSIYSA